MSCEDAAAITEAVLAALQGPKRVRGDAGEVEQHSVGDLIKAAQYANGQCAVETPRRGLRYSRFIPPGLG